MGNETEVPRVFPMQVHLGYNREAGAITEPVYMAAYEVYAHIHGPQKAMIDFGAGCRGGFSAAEIIGFLYARAFPKSEWSARADEAFRNMRGIK